MLTVAGDARLAERVDGLLCDPVGEQPGRRRVADAGADHGQSLLVRIGW